MITEMVDRSHPGFMLSEEDIGVDALAGDALDGLIAMKYDPDDLIAQAKSYKDEGNRHIQKNKFDLAVENYTAGLKLQCGDKETNSQLHFNRAIAHFKRGNYRTALGDFEAATKLVQPYFKAIFKAAECCLHLKRFADCLAWCEKGLEVEPENKLILDTREKCKAEMQKAKLAEEKQLAARKRAEMETEALMTALKSHGVRFHPSTLFTPEWFQANCPQGSAPKFASLTEMSAICWPVLISYPELKKQDFVESFNEQLPVFEMLYMMLGPEAQRTDLDSAYSPENCDVYFENVFKRKLVQVDVKLPLLTTLRRSDLIILNGTPIFVVLNKTRKDFNAEFLKLYDNVEKL